MTAPLSAPMAELARIDGGKIRPISAPIPRPAQSHFRLASSLTESISILPLSFFQTIAESYSPMKPWL